MTHNPFVTNTYKVLALLSRLLHQWSMAFIGRNPARNPAPQVAQTLPTQAQGAWRFRLSLVVF
jgi:hypothetical protein